MRYVPLEHNNEIAVNASLIRMLHIRILTYGRIHGDLHRDLDATDLPCNVSLTVPEREKQGMLMRKQRTQAASVSQNL